MSTVWKGQLNFGLLSMPVRLDTAVKSETFNLLHKCGKRRRSRVKQQYTCAKESVVVERGQMVKGYEFKPGRFIDVTSEEIKELSAEATPALELLAFVRLEEIDPLLFNSGYSLLPELEEGKRAYAVLFRTLCRMDMVAVTRIALQSRERMAILRPGTRSIVLQTLFYPQEISSDCMPDDSTLPGATELELACELARTLESPWNPAKYPDPLRKKVDLLLKRRLKAYQQQIESKSGVVDISKHRAKQ